MKLIVITHPEDFDAEQVSLKKMFKGGMNTLHIRKPKYSKKDMERFISEIPDKYHKKLVLHSHHSLAFKFKIKGIHFTENHRKNFVMHFLRYGMFSMLKNRLQLSASYHSIKEIEKLGSLYKYVFLSPVFTSISKGKKKKEMDLSRIQDALRQTKAKVIALGGVDKDKLVRCQNVGFVGVAVLGAVWDSPDPVDAFTKLYELCRKARYQSLALED